MGFTFRIAAGPFQGRRTCPSPAAKPTLKNHPGPACLADSLTGVFWQGKIQAVRKWFPPGLCSAERMAGKSTQRRAELLGDLSSLSLPPWPPSCRALHPSLPFRNAGRQPQTPPHCSGEARLSRGFLLSLPNTDFPPLPLLPPSPPSLRPRVPLCREMPRCHGDEAGLDQSVSLSSSPSLFA